MLSKEPGHKRDHTFDNYCLKGMSTINKSIEIEKRVEVAKSWSRGDTELLLIWIGFHSGVMIYSAIR